MRRLLLVPCVLALFTNSVLGNSFVTMDTATQSKSTLVLEAKTSSFDLYGPAGPNCVGPDCPTMKDLERIARRGVNVLKISGGDVSELGNIFPIPPKEDADKTAEMMPDNFKTGPLPDGATQDMVAGVETEFMPDIVPEFEPELTSNMRSNEGADDLEIWMNASDESLNALIGAL